jgi:hypothetical protein
MERVVIYSRVDADGVLRLSVPMGAAAADGEVEITIEAAHPRQQTSAEEEEWRQFVLSTAGAWQGELERPSEGEYEERDELP